MNVLKKIAQATIAFLIGTMFAFVVFHSVFVSAVKLPTVEEIQDFDNVSVNLPAQEQNALRKSRNSTVRIFQNSMEEYLISQEQILQLKIDILF